MFQYLELSDDYDSKRAICHRLLTVLPNLPDLGAEQKSHYMLETMLYAVRLTNQAQHGPTAVSLLKV